MNIYKKNVRIIFQMQNRQILFQNYYITYFLLFAQLNSYLNFNFDLVLLSFVSFKRLLNERVESGLGTRKIMPSHYHLYVHLTMNWGMNNNSISHYSVFVIYFMVDVCLVLRSWMSIIYIRWEMKMVFTIMARRCGISVSNFLIYFVHCFLLFGSLFTIHCSDGKYRI